MIDFLRVAFLVALLSATTVKCIEILVDMAWTLRVGSRFANAIQAEVDAHQAVDVGDIERDFRRLQPVYRCLSRLERHAPLLGRVLRAGYWAPGLATLLTVGSAFDEPRPMALPLAVACTSFTTLILINAPLKRLAFRGYDRYNRDILLGAWQHRDEMRVESDRAVRAVTCYFLWLIYVSVLGFSATYTWASSVDSSAFSADLAFPTSMFFSLGVVSTVGIVGSTAQSLTAQTLVAAQVATGPLILAWLLTEIAPHRIVSKLPQTPADVEPSSGGKRFLAAALIVDSEHRVLLAERRRTVDFRPGKWDLIGGHIEVGEDPRAAVVREVYEEVGVKVLSLSVEPDARWIEDGYDLRIWAVRDWSGRPRNYAKGQHRRLRFFSMREVHNLHLGDQKYLSLFERLTAPRE